LGRLAKGLLARRRLLAAPDRPAQRLLAQDHGPDRIHRPLPPLPGCIANRPVRTRTPGGVGGAGVSPAPTRFEGATARKPPAQRPARRLAVDPTRRATGSGGRGRLPIVLCGNVDRTLHSMRPRPGETGQHGPGVRGGENSRDSTARSASSVTGPRTTWGPVRPRVMSSVTRASPLRSPRARAATSARTPPRRAPRTRCRRSSRRLPPRRHDQARSRKRRRARPRPRFRPRV
jgi:hypothetical protein